MGQNIHNISKLTTKNFKFIYVDNDNQFISWLPIDINELQKLNINDVAKKQKLTTFNVKQYVKLQIENIQKLNEKTQQIAKNEQLEFWDCKVVIPNDNIPYEYFTGHITFVYNVLHLTEKFKDFKNDNITHKY